MPLLGRIAIVNSWCSALESCGDTVTCGPQQLGILRLEGPDECLIKLRGNSHESEILGGVSEREIIAVVAEPRKELEQHKRLVV